MPILFCTVPLEHNADPSIYSSIHSFTQQQQKNGQLLYTSHILMPTISFFFVPGIFEFIYQSIFQPF